VRPLGATPILPEPIPRARREARRTSSLVLREVYIEPIREAPEAFPLELLAGFLDGPLTWDELAELRSGGRKYTRAAWREMLMLAEDEGLLRWDSARAAWRLTDHGAALAPRTS
jgi:hypothetical protein